MPNLAWPEEGGTLGGYAGRRALRPEMLAQDFLVAEAVLQGERDRVGLRECLEFRRGFFGGCRFHEDDEHVGTGNRLRIGGSPGMNQGYLTRCGVLDREARFVDSVDMFLVDVVQDHILPGESESPSEQRSHRA